MYDCKLMFINAAMQCVLLEKNQEGTSLRRRHFFLSLLGIKTQILLCHTATVPYLWLMLKKRRATGKAAQAAYRSLRRKEKKRSYNRRTTDYAQVVIPYMLRIKGCSLCLRLHSPYYRKPFFSFSLLIPFCYIHRKIKEVHREWGKKTRK